MSISNGKNKDWRGDWNKFIIVIQTSVDYEDKGLYLLSTKAKLIPQCFIFICSNTPLSSQ